MADNDALQTWKVDFIRALQLLRRVGIAIKAPPQGEPSAERLQTLLAVRVALEVDDLQLRPHRAAAEALANAACSQTNRDYLAEVAALEAAGGIDAEIAKTVAALDEKTVHSAGLIRTSDFGDGFRIIELPPAGGLLVAGIVDFLPADHPLRNVVPADDFLRLEMSHEPYRPALLLGPPVAQLAGPARPRPFYGIAAALSLTRLFRNRQKERDQEREAQERRQRQQDEQERAMQSNTREALARRVAELETKLGTARGTANAR